MSLLHNDDFTIWQLRTSYLSAIKDGIGERLINVNNSVLNAPGFRAAGWSSLPTNTNHGAQSASASIKRTYSPPIPITRGTLSGNYRVDANDTAADTRPVDLKDGGEDDDGGMVTGKNVMDIADVRSAMRTGKKARRKDRQHDQQRRGEVDDDDSSDLSDESDDDGDSTQRSTQQIKFSKMPIRIRAGSSPIRSTDRYETPGTTESSPSRPGRSGHYRTGSVGTPVAVNKQRPRRDTTTSSDMSSDNEIDPSRFQQRQIQFSGQDEVISQKEGRDYRNSGFDDITEELDEHPDDSGAESVGSALSSDFGATAGSGSLLDIDITGSLDSSSPVALMHKVQNETGPQVASPRKQKTSTSASELQDLPPPRPISLIQPVSLLSKQLNARKKAPSNPFDRFAVVSGKGVNDALNIRVYLPFSSDPDIALDLAVVRESKLIDQLASVTVAEAIGLALWTYLEEDRIPQLERSQLTVNRWTLRMVEDGEVEYDFPALGQCLPFTDFTSNNNRAAASRGRSRGKQYDEFALVEASQSEFEENERLLPKFSLLSRESGDSSGVLQDSKNQPAARSKALTTRQNPILGQPFSSALNDSRLTPADRPAVQISHATPRMGVSKNLRVRFVNREASAHVMTVNTSTDSYLAEILDTVCKRWGLDKGIYHLKVTGSSTVAPLDRTVEALGNITDLDLERRRFGAGPLSLTGSPGSSSPNAPLLIESNGAMSKKAKKGEKRMMHPLAQKPDLIGGYYRRYHVFRKQPMSFTATNYRILAFDTDYMHIMPGDTGKTVSDTKTRSLSFNDVVGCKVSRRHPKNFRVVVLRGGNPNEQKRYDFEARNALEAIEIVDEIKKNMAQYRN